MQDKLSKYDYKTCKKYQIRLKRIRRLIDISIYEIEQYGGCRTDKTDKMIRSVQQLTSTIKTIMPIESAISEAIEKNKESHKKQKEQDISRNDVKIIRNYLEKMRDIENHKKMSQAAQISSST